MKPYTIDQVKKSFTNHGFVYRVWNYKDGTSRAVFNREIGAIFSDYRVDVDVDSSGFCTIEGTNPKVWAERLKNLTGKLPWETFDSKD